MKAECFLSREAGSDCGKVVVEGVGERVGLSTRTPMRDRTRATLSLPKLKANKVTKGEVAAWQGQRERQRKGGRKMEKEKGAGRIGATTPPPPPPPRPAQDR